MKNEFDNIHLPISLLKPLPEKHLSMDDFDRFNEEGLANNFDREAYMREKRLREVNVMFVLDKAEDVVE